MLVVLEGDLCTCLCIKPNSRTLVLGMFRDNHFRGQEIVALDPGYQDGSAPVLIRAPFYKDKALF